MKKKLSLNLTLVALCAGCVSYSHVASDGSRTSFSAFAVKGDASKIHSITANNGTNYTRTVSVGSVKGESQADQLVSIAEAIATGVVKGIKP